MHSLRTAAIAIVTALLCAGRVAAAEGPGLGVAATPAEIAAADLSIAPDGGGLPPGSGLARDGAGIYMANCLACHGLEGAGQPYDRLVGGRGTLREAKPVRTAGSYWPYATTLFDYIRRAMPYPQPHSLSADETYALTAYLLYLNGVVGENEAMNAQTLPRVVMPNRDNFISAYPAALALP
jgi:cytochrome c